MLALAYLPILGNGQDGALPPTVVQNAPGIQGNVAWTRAQQDAELDRAAAAARQKKAVMESMLTQVQRPPVITSAEQYLAVNRPAVPRSPEGSGPSPQAMRSNAYVPAFENAPARTGVAQGATSAPASPELPQKKGGLFSLFKSKEKEAETAPDLPPPPPASYPETPVGETMGSAPPAEEAASSSSATEQSVEAEKPSLFGKLFARDKATEPSLPGQATLLPPAGDAGAVGAMPTVPEAAEAPATTGSPDGIPNPPSFDAPEAPTSAPTAPATGNESGDAPIFSRRSSSSGGGAGPTAIVLAASQATVGGVLVRLYEGTQVTVLERNGSMARIRLADGREGTIAASALSR